MRIRSLTLEAYGPFTGTRLAFRPDARLHVIYGANEAGKSSALAAITDLLFGFGHTTSFDFEHEAKDLRVGAEIVDGKGDVLAVRRRKGRAGTLIGADDKPLRDDVLTPYLGTLTREVFCRAFGLDATALRNGADAILSSEGDVGATLLAAAAGLRDLTNLRSQLETEADEIFAPTRSAKRRFYQALDRHEAARKAIGTHELRAPDWKKLNEAIAEAQAAGERIAQERKAVAARARRLERVKRVRPVMSDLDAQVQALAACDHLPKVADGFASALSDALDGATKSGDAVLRATAEHDAARLAHAAVAVDETLMQHAGEIERLYQQIGAYQQALREQPRVQSELDGIAARLHASSVALGFADIGDLEARQPTAAAQKLVEVQIAEGRELALDKQAVEKELSAIDRDRTRLESERAAGVALVDPAPLRERLAALLPAAAQHESCEKALRAVKAGAATLAEDALRLDPPVADLDAMARAALPGAEAVARLRKALADAAVVLARNEDRSAAAREAELAADRRLAALVAGRPVPSEDRIAAARAARDASFAGFRDHLLDVAPMPAAVRARAIVMHERLVAEADRLSDEAARDAERVAQHGVVAADLAERQHARAAAEAAVATARTRHDSAQADWQALWAAAGIDARQPEDMADWTTRLQTLFRRREQLEAQRLDAEANAAALARTLPDLSDLCRLVGLPDMDGLPIPQALQRLDRKIATLEDAWAHARQRETQIALLGRQAEAARAKQATTAGILTDWKARFGKALRDIGLSGFEGVEQVEAALAEWKKVPPTLAERQNRLGRVNGMQRNRDTFARDAVALVAAVAPDLGRLPPDAAVQSLPERLTAARNAATRREERAQALEKAATAMARAERERDLAATRLTSVVAGLPASVDDLPALRDALHRRDGILAKIAEHRGRLQDVSDGLPEADLRADLAASDPDMIEAELADLTAREQRLDAESREVFATGQKRRDERADLEVGTGAELALQERSNAAADLAAAAHDYKVLRIGALLLGAALERHRAGRQDPLMLRAGALFAELAGGAWTGLTQDFDETDQTRLYACRREGKPLKLTVQQLSEGTRDQLYFALRLAYLENYAERAEAAPFVGDDLFATFDDERTARGLAALASVGSKVQPLLFTHHRHVADLAVAHLGAAADVVELR